jgi:phage terminase small subunit
MEKLTPKLERFCRFVAVENLNGSEAWIAAGNKCTPRSASVTASRWLKKANIKARIAKLKEQANKETKRISTITRDDKLIRLEGIAWAANAKPSDVIAAIRVHNEMTGDNAPQKHVINDGSERMKTARERALSYASPLNRLVNNGRENLVEPRGN